jgi:hypothetical protein
LCIHWPDLPLFAAQRAAPNRWLLQAPSDDPLAPAVRVVAARAEPAYVGARKWRSAKVIRAFRASDPAKPKPKPGTEDTWPREQLWQLACLLDRLAPPSSTHPELYFEQRNALSCELKRLARVGR